MPTPTYTALANLTLASNTGTITFSNIPATYRDLILVIDILGLTGGASSRNAYMTFNSTQGTTVYMYGGGGAAVSGTDATDVLLPYGSTRNLTVMNIMDYSATDKHKTILQRTGYAENVAWALGSRVATTSAITTFSIFGSDNATDLFITGCTFSLYGVIA